MQTFPPGYHCYNVQSSDLVGNITIAVCFLWGWGYDNCLKYSSGKCTNGVASMDLEIMT